MSKKGNKNDDVKIKKRLFEKHPNMKIPQHTIENIWKKIKAKLFEDNLL
jgi:predicted RNA binding protein YcfA (HicA-like mRNA interferase family)